MQFVSVPYVTGPQALKSITAEFSRRVITPAVHVRFKLFTQQAYDVWINYYGHLSSYITLNNVGIVSNELEVNVLSA